MSTQFNCKKKKNSVSINSILTNSSNSINSVSYKYKFCSHIVKCQNSSFQTIEFNISTQFSSIWSIDRILSGATTPSHRGPGTDSNEGVYSIPQRSKITGTLRSDFLVSYPWHSLGGGSVLCRDAVSLFYSPRRLVNRK